MDLPFANREVPPLGKREVALERETPKGVMMAKVS